MKRVFLMLAVVLALFSGCLPYYEDTSLPPTPPATLRVDDVATASPTPLPDVDLLTPRPSEEELSFSVLTLQSGSETVIAVNIQEGTVQSLRLLSVAVDGVLLDFTTLSEQEASVYPEAFTAFRLAYSCTDSVPAYFTVRVVTDDGEREIAFGALIG